MGERWADVRGFGGDYQVSDQGRVRSLKRVPKLLALVKSRRGYVQVNLYRDGRATNFLVHRLVFDAFAGPIRPGFQVNHRDADKTNNKLENLEQVTGAENREHARRKGLVRPRIGEANVSAKLTEEDVRAVRQLRREDVPVQEIAWRYRIGVRAVYSIIKGETWGHVV